MHGECVFCRVVKGEIPAVKLYEDAIVLSFLDIKPAAKGHAIVIPKNHYKTLLDVPHEEMKAVMAAVQKVAAAIMAEIPGVEGFNVLQSNSEAAGQVIPHIHFHIIPRKKGDKLNFSWAPGQSEKSELEKYAELLKKKIR
ncbi:MAG: HIT family protein [Candidatus Diapherotrites archaeon]|nr:HIT family protein [Candidatus Diapherotrites archaeon]